MCPHCGKSSRPGSLFCQHCGKRMVDEKGTAGLGPEVAAARLPEPPGAVTCPACAAQNPATMNFCKMCGEPLRAAPALAPTTPDDRRPAASPAPARSRISLPSALAAVAGPAATPPSGPTVIVPAPAASSPIKATPTVVARKPGASAPEAVVTGLKPARSCAACGGSTPVGFAFCQHCGVRLDAADTAPAGATEAGVADTLASPDEVVPLVKKRVPDKAVAWARLIAIHRDGSDGDTHALVDEAVDIGRTDGGLLFDDRFLAPRHARIENRPVKGPVVTPLEQVNGVYFRLRPGETCPLLDGDQLLVGKEVLRFEVLDPEERALGPALQNGVRLFGSPVRAPWARLRQIVQSGVSRDIYHLSSPEVVLGREEGDLRFGDDEFMSRRHAKIVNRDARFEVIDLESSNGTFVRVRAERVLRSGDHLRMGDQLFRFELD